MTIPSTPGDQPPENSGSPRLQQVAGRLKTARPSFGQERLWLVQQLAPQSAAYSEMSAIRVQGPLDLALLERSVNEVVKRHEVLRTAFAVVKGRPVQVILRSLNVPLRVQDLRHLPPAQREAESRQRLAAEARQPFDLAKAPLFRSSVIRLAGEDHILAYTVHHIIGDAQAVAILNEEVVQAYRDLALGQRLSLPPLTATYAEFAQRQRTELEGPRLAELLEYWERRLAGMVPLELPCDRPRPVLPSFRGDVVTVRVPSNLYQRLKEWGRSEGASPYTTLLAAVNTLLFRWSGQTDLVIATVVTARNRPEWERMIGFFVNTLMVRADLSAEMSFRELVARTRAAFLEDYAHGDLPFEYLVRHVRPGRGVTGTPLYNVHFALNAGPYDAVQRAAGAYAFRLSEVPVHNQAAKMDLAFLCWQTSLELKLSLEYSTDLFDRPTIERLADSFLTLLDAALADPDQSIRELPLLTSAQRRQVLHDWNATGESPASPATAHLRIEEQARQHSASPAVEFQGRTLTYDELNRRANQLAHAMIRRGVGPGKIVGICLHRSLEMIEAILAVWKAGAAHVAIDPSYPARRVAWIVEDCRPHLILAHRDIANVLDQGTPLMELNESWMGLADEDDSNPGVAVAPHDLAYVCYTSGSTGRPKGAMICHSNLANLCQGLEQHRQYWERCRVLMIHSLVFDAAIFHVTLALQNGGTLVLGGPGAAQPGPGLVSLLRDAKINFVLIPPSVLALLPAADLPDLKTLGVAGEACPSSLVERWAPGRTMLNCYGPTETTVWATMAVCEPDGSSPPIGRPVAHFRCYVLDGCGQPVPVGAAGELYLGGPSVALGYLNRPELTAEKFVPDPYSAEAGARLYRTGDRCRWRPDGQLEFLGRFDHQIKLLGYRIELGEIETALMDHPAVRQACVLMRRDEAVGPCLHAFVSRAESSILDLAGELREWLSARLPSYMLPASITFLDELPLNVSGKADRGALSRILPAAPTPPPRQAALSDGSAESLLSRIWRETLGAEQIGREDNFFERGGDSIMALQVVARARQEGLPLQPFHIFQHQTIAALAASVVAVEADGEGSTSLFSLAGLEQSGLGPLLPLRTSGAGQPLFCVHHVAGLGLQFWDLVRCLPDERPVYALQAAGLDGGQPRTSIEEMAAAYVEQIRSLQPAGPYLLAGYSFGGVVAYEIAQQLTSAGQEVALLAMIDRPIPDSLLTAASSKADRSLDAEWSIGVVQLIELLWGVRISLPDEGHRSFTVDELLERIMKNAGEASSAGALRSLVEAAGERLLRNIFRVVEANMAASRAYSPRPYAGSITLFRAAELHASATPELATVFAEPDMGWRRLAERVSVIIVPGDHFTMIGPPHVSALAAKLQEALNAASRGGRG